MSRAQEAKWLGTLAQFAPLGWSYGVDKGLRVLVVDDNRQMAKTLAGVLNLKGFEAEAACSGNSALKMLEADRFDCVITDVTMPDVSGVDLLRAINSVRPHLPVVLMTANATSDLMHDGSREGAVASFVKPLDLDLLVSFLTGLAGQSRDLAPVLRGCSGVLVSQTP